MQAHHYPILYQVEETHWWYVGRRRIIRSLVEKICTTLNSNPRILDVGCGTGANLKALAEYGRAEGVDISPQAIDFCRERGLDSVKLGDRAPALGNQTLLGHIQIEEIQRVVDRFDLSHFRQPSSHISGSGNLRMEKMDVVPIP